MSSHHQQRTALGRVSSSRLNVQASPGGEVNASKISKSRMSLGPGTTISSRYSLGGAGMTTAKKKKNQRMSMMPTMGMSTVNRRMSMMSTQSNMRRRSIATGGGGLRNDPRPLSDKGFTRTSIENLIRFLVDHNYDQAISPKILSRPTGKDFENVVTFLFSLVDPHGKPSGKFADDVTTMFKGLKYPFNISKTALAAVGSPHTWPALLASLTWLVELLEYDEQVGLGSEDFGMDSEGDADQDCDKQFFIYLQQAYAFFLAGDDESADALDEQRKSYILQDQEAILQAANQAQNTKAGLDRQLSEESATPSLIPDLEQRKRDFQSDKLKWDKLIRQFEENKEIMISKVKEREAECRAKEEELATCQRNKEQIQRALDEQELSPADAERMNQERRGLDTAQNRVLEQRDELQKTVWDLEMSISKATQTIEAIIDEYNETAKTLRLVQQTGQGANIILKLNPSTSSVICVDADGTPARDCDASSIEKALQDLKELSHNKLHQIRTESMELKITCEENEEEQASLLAEIKVREQRVEQANRQNEQDKQAMERELAEKANDTEQVEEEIHHLHAEAQLLDQPLQQARLKLDALTAQLERETAENERELALVDEELERAVELCCSHQEDVTSQLEKLEADLTSRLEKAKEECKSVVEAMVPQT